jgi:hypothetical protein
MCHFGGTIARLQRPSGFSGPPSKANIPDLRAGATKGGAYLLIKQALRKEWANAK